MSAAPHPPPAPASEESTAADAHTGGRRSRWGDAAADDAGPRKRSRWGDKVQPSVPVLVSAEEAAAKARAVAAALSGTTHTHANSPLPPHLAPLQARVEELGSILAQPSLTAHFREPRSPSPDPVYDDRGQRTNTREQRTRAKLTAERANLIAELQTAHSTYRAPADYKRPARFERRLYIPVREHPDYNFIGLILGPRGATQKEMEKEFGCKIVIRGRGSSKDSRTNTADAHANDDIHVLILADTEAKVEAAAAKVSTLLVKTDDAGNEHKSKQLRELALINGTLRDELACRQCGGLGHRAAVCPERSAVRYHHQIRCERCGLPTHVTRDCPLGPASEDSDGLNGSGDPLEAELKSFMDEITYNGANHAHSHIKFAGLLEGRSEPRAEGEETDASERQTASPTSSATVSVHSRSPPRSLTSASASASSVTRVGDGIVRRIATNDPRETAREFRPRGAVHVHPDRVERFALPAHPHAHAHYPPPPAHYPPHHYHSHAPPVPYPSHPHYTYSPQRYPPAAAGEAYGQWPR